jgi:DNA-binding NarL/FixJ family response regulator
MEPSALQLEAGRASYEQRAWGAATRTLAAADRTAPLGAADLWRLALSAYLAGRSDAFLEAAERAHQEHLDAGETGAAVRCAFWIGFHLANQGEIGRATGWFGRAGRLLDREGGDCAERGYLLLPIARQQLASGDFAGCLHTAAEAAAAGERFGEADLLALAVHLQGLALMGSARIADGLALMDEAMVAVATDALSPQVTGLIYCSVISACRRVYALRRAQEWTAALTSWCERQPDLIAYAGECQLYRAEALQIRGAWRDSIEESRRAGERLSRGLDPRAAALALYQQGEVHRLLGEFAAAEEAYRGASRLGREPQPGLALLRLAQRDVAAAVASIRRALAETADRFQRARLLPAHIEILLAAEEQDDAERACRELEEIACAVDGGVLGTHAAQARGAVELAAGRAAAALPPLRRAWHDWQALDAPYEAARVRALLGLACRALGDHDTAALEIEAARAEFLRLGAAPDVARLDLLSHGPGPRRSHGLTPREIEVLALVARGQTNRAIAAELSISEKTVARHLANMFTKLGLSSRAAATAYAYEHDLLRASA